MKTLQQKIEKAETLNKLCRKYGRDYLDDYVKSVHELCELRTADNGFDPILNYHFGQIEFYNLRY